MLLYLSISLLDQGTLSLITITQELVYLSQDVV